MDDRKIYLLALMAAAFVIFMVIVEVLDSRGINSIRSKTVGDGQHGVRP